MTKIDKAAKSKSFALDQVRRLKSKPFYPPVDTEDDGKKINHGERELARTLFEYCDSDQHMQRVIDAAVIRSFGDSGDRCPGPSDLWALCREINPVAAKPVVINPDCPECEGQGFQIVHGQHGITGASACPRGCKPAGYNFNGDKLSRRAISDWYGAELAGASARKQALIARRGSVPPKVTDDMIDSLRQYQEQHRMNRA